MTAPVDYNAVLADLEARRGQIDAAIAVIRALIGSGATAPIEAGAGSLADPGEGFVTISGPRGASATGIPSDAFFRLSTASAIRKYLGMMKRPQTARAIADAMIAGGQVHATTPEIAYRNVHTALTRGKDKEFVRTRNKDWGLVEWYGASKAKLDDE
jgi:hypothetical protein